MMQQVVVDPKAVPLNPFSSFKALNKKLVRGTLVKNESGITLPIINYYVS